MNAGCAARPPPTSMPSRARAAAVVHMSSAASTRPARASAPASAAYVLPVGVAPARCMASSMRRVASTCPAPAAPCAAAVHDATVGSSPARIADTPSSLAARRESPARAYACDRLTYVPSVGLGFERSAGSSTSRARSSVAVRSPARLWPHSSTLCVVTLGATPSSRPTRSTRASAPGTSPCVTSAVTAAFIACASAAIPSTCRICLKSASARALCSSSPLKPPMTAV
mmetsp:Transcript_20842/g.64610  ORF Transcript_20842/g.64610 Transcript_20842/m.64610 type:complete len:228 (+) Transcript_20842:193-876(+)